MSNFKTIELEQWGPIDARPLYQSFWFIASVKNSFWPRMIAIYDHDRSIFYWHKDEMQRAGEKALGEIFKSAKCRKLWRKYFKIVESMQILARKGSVPVGTWYDYLNLLWRITFIIESANFAAPDYLKKKIEKLVPKEELDKVLEIMLAPEKLSFHQLSELELLRAKDFTKYARRWYWVENSYYKSKILSADYFKSQIKFSGKKARQAKIKKILSYAEEVKRKKALVIKKYHLPKEIIRQASAMTFSIWWQDHRKRIILWSNSITDEINKKLSHRFKISEDELMHYTAEEWVKLGEKNIIVAKKIIKERKKYAVFEFLEDNFKLYYGKRARKIINKWLPKEKKLNKNEFLRGIVVSAGQAGKIRGRVRVLYSPRFANKMKAGNILVAPMTSPDFIVAMRQAKAIVTDVGGLMSHAAVVSRELGIPCIVNTKIATKVLHDGDLVEVDAERGIVKIIKNSGFPPTRE
ncbi:MAG: PEP-utilizing enzyme [Patescibacteria group bacterium]|nr:PEP-utilizing enzyme [Patescibacteria group bacterium]